VNDAPNSSDEPAALDHWLRTPGARVHLAGIGGVGMAGLAVLLKARGLVVSGCDVSMNALAEWLRKQGIPVAQNHDPSHVEGADVVIRSAAVPEDAPELAAARARGLSVFRRGEVLPALAGGAGSIAVAGTHGKTTTSSLIAQVLASAGREPTFCIGGEAPPLGGVAAAGKGGETVVEADESDGTLALYAPDYAVVTNIEFDHMEHFATVDEFEACFARFIRQTRKKVVYCADDPRASRLCAGNPKGLSYGFGGAADVVIAVSNETAAGSEFVLSKGGAALGELALPAPGRHNMLNAAACALVALELGLTFDAIRAGLGKASLPRRRFDRLVDRDDAIVISDYAHHPTEIAALIRTARHLARRRILGVFQPHRYTRTLALGPDFPAAFEGLTELVLLPVYAASEAPLPGGSTWDLYGHCRRRGGVNVKVAASLRQAWEYCRGQLRLGDLFLVIGAGDVERIALWARDELTPTRVEDLETVMRRAIRHMDLDASVVRGNEPLAGKTTLGVGGSADLWMELGSENDLRQTLRWTAAEDIPFTILGGGSNVVVSDLGVRGVVARLGGEAFRGLRMKDGLVAAGAGAPLARLVAWAAENGWSGLEPLAGIPGTVGGALCGNAGAHGAAIGECVDWVRTFLPNGEEHRIGKLELDFEYRRCPCLRGKIVVEAGFRLRSAEPAGVAARVAEVVAARSWMKGLRSAGSVFKNPPNDFAGRLIEGAGMKGAAVGGASLSTRHANVMVTEAGATASDVLALMAAARDAVQRKNGVRLETEIVVME